MEEQRGLRVYVRMPLNYVYKKLHMHLEKLVEHTKMLTAVDMEPEFTDKAYVHCYLFL